MKVFQSFRLDPVNQCLWRGDERVAITPRAFDVLRYMVEHSGRLVTHDEILDALWPRAHVNPEVVKKYMLAIRKVLGDDPQGATFIETMPRRGYRFVAAVMEDRGDAALPMAEVEPVGLVGRDAALAKLDGHLDEARRGRRQVVFVTGEPGIGKTALADAFQQRAARLTGVRIARGQCVEGFGGKEAYYPVLDALGELTRDRSSTPIVQALAVHAPTWLVQLPALVKASQRDALQREILGATRERMLREICEALDAITRDSPLILVFEDLQWADPSTLDLISALARRREAAKLLVACTYRPVDVDPLQSSLRSLKSELHSQGLCAEIVVERLAVDDVARYVEGKFTGSPATGFAEFLHRRCGGNPLFMRAIVQDMRDKGAIVEEAGAWRLAASLEKIDGRMPQTLQQMLDVQFHRLGASEQQVLRSACVAGHRFSAWLIAATLDMTVEEVEDICEGLADRQNLIKASGIDEVSPGVFSACYEFIHWLHREGIYRGLSDVSRPRLHRKIAARLESQRPAGDAKLEAAAELARHFEHGHDFARAIEYLFGAAVLAGTRFAYRESIRILEHALELVPRLASGAEVECRIHESIGDAHYALGAMAESARSYQLAAAHADRAGLKALQVGALSSLVRPLGLIDPSQGIAAIDQAARASEGLDDPLLVARTRMLAASTRLLYDDWRAADALACAASYEALRGRGDDEELSFHGMLHGHVLALEGRYDEAIDLFDRGLSTSRLITHFFALSGKTVALLRCGRLGEVLRIVRDGQAMAAKNGNEPWLFTFREAWLRMVALDFEGARRLCEGMIGSGPRYPTDQPQVIAFVAEAHAELERGDHERAIVAFTKVADARSPGKFFLHWLWRMTARLGLCDASLASGDLERARESCDLFLRKALATSEPSLRALAWDRKAKLAMAAGDDTAAHGHIQKALSAMESFAIPMAAWEINATACELNARAGRDAEADAHRAVAAACLAGVADSFTPDEPLRASLLAAARKRQRAMGHDGLLIRQ